MRVMRELKKIGLLSLVFALVLACNTKSKEEHDGHNHEEGVYYTCSMDPQVKEDKPGKCPICHMELTPMKNDDGASNEISLSDQQIKFREYHYGDYRRFAKQSGRKLYRCFNHQSGAIEKHFFESDGAYRKIIF